MDAIRFVRAETRLSEQYNAVDCDDNIIARLRCHDGVFEIYAPDGEEVYMTEIAGDDFFEDDERDQQLRAAKWAIVNYYIGERVYA